MGSSSIGNNNSSSSASILTQIEQDQVDDDRKRAVKIQASSRSTARGALSHVTDQAAGQTNTTLAVDQTRNTSTIGASGAAPLDRTASVQDVAAHQQVLGSAETRLVPASAPTVTLTADRQRAAESFATNLDAVMNAIVGGSKPATRSSVDVGKASVQTVGASDPATVADIDGLSSDQLLSAFLKLNINDPNENVETHDALYQAASNLRLQALEDAKKQTDNAEQQMKDAEKYADQAKMIGTVVEVASIALTICTFGMGAVVGVAATAAAEGATTAATTAANTALQAAQQGAQQAIQQGISSGTEAATQAATNAAQAGANTAVSGAEQVATQGASKAAAQIPAQTAQQIGQQAGQQAWDQMGSQMQNQLADQIQNAAKSQGIDISRETAMNAARQSVTQEVTQGIAQNLAQEGFTTAAQNMMANSPQALAQAAQTGVRGAINYASSVLQNAAVPNTATVAMTAVNAGGQAVAATANYKAQDKMLDAKSSMLRADRSHLVADEAQQRVTEESDIINTIMETKNQTVDTVMKMITQSFATRQQLLSATMSR